MYRNTVRTVDLRFKIKIEEGNIDISMMVM